MRHSDSWTALMVCCCYSNNHTDKFVKMLVDAGTDVNIHSRSEWTALILASRYCDGRSIERVIKILLDAKADVNAQHFNKWTAPMVFLDNNNITADDQQTIMRLLIDAGYDVNLPNTANNTVLDLAINKNLGAITKILIDAKVKQENIRNHKKYIYKFVISGIPLHNNIVKFHPGNFGCKISELNFRLKNGEPEEIYGKLIESNDSLIDYLNIVDATDLVKKITQYLFES